MSFDYLALYNPMLYIHSLRYLLTRITYFSNNKSTRRTQVIDKLDRDLSKHSVKDYGVRQRNKARSSMPLFTKTESQNQLCKSVRQIK